MAGPTFPLWPFRPNWSGTVTETLAWLTDVMESRTGVEQRRSLRQTPRKQIEYTGLHQGRERAMLDNLLNGVGEHDWMLPIWWDQHFPERSLVAGENFIPCVTARFGQFRIGGWAVLMIGKFEYEVVQVAGFSATGIGLTAPLARPWSAGARIFPLQRSRLDGRPQFSRRSDATVLSSFRFNVTEPDILAGVDSAPSKGILINGLLGRQYSPEQDDSLYAPEAGITVGQAAMMRACFTAYSVLAPLTDQGASVAADSYLTLALTLLDGFVGTGASTGAMLRQPLPTTAGDLVLPHWLYAARGAIDELADVGEGYELFPVPAPTPAGFASAAPEAFRDLDIALGQAASFDTRAAGNKAAWTLLRNALMGSNAEGRKLRDGRDVFVPWPGLPVIAMQDAEPKGLFVNSGHSDAKANLELGVNANVTGYNFLSRDTNGEIVLDVPNSYEYAQGEIPTPTSGTPTGETTTVTNKIPVLRTTRYGRYFKDKWRSASYAGKQDQFLYINMILNRTPDNNAGENVFIEIASGPNLYRGTIDASIVAGSAVKPFLLARSRFVHTSTGAPLPLDAVIDSFAVCVSAVLAYRMRLRAMRLVSGDSEDQVAANLATAIQGDRVAFSPGVNPFRISGYVDRDLFIGYTGSPWTGAQTPDIWPLMAARGLGSFAGYGPSNVNVATSAGLSYPFTGTTAGGVTKPPEALLAEQNVAFLIQAQDEFTARNSGVVGPFMYTFLQNRPERFQFGDNAQPFSWLYNNATTERDIFWQCLTAEACASMARLANNPAKRVLYNGQQVTVNGKALVAYAKPTGTVLSFLDSRGWLDTVNYSLIPVMRFLRWFDTAWTYPAIVTHRGVVVTMNGTPVRATITPDNPVYGDPIRYIDDPALEVAKHSPAPHAVAVYLRAALWVRIIDNQDGAYADTLIVQSFQYLERFWQEDGTFAKTWSTDENEMRWWYSQFILTYSEMLNNKDFVPASIDRNLIEKRLIETVKWLETTGSQVGETIPGFDRTYRGTGVLTRAPNEVNNMTVISERLTEDFDNDVSIPLRSEYDPGVWNRPQYTWWINGREEHDTFRKMLYAMRGKSSPFWNISHMADFEAVSAVDAGSSYIEVENVAYVSSGGPRRTHEHIAIITYDGDILFRQIVNAEEIDEDRERIFLNSPIRSRLEQTDILRISFMDLVRLDQDGIQIAHTGDTEGVSSSTTVFKSLKTI